MAAVKSLRAVVVNKTLNATGGKKGVGEQRTCASRRISPGRQERVPPQQEVGHRRRVAYIAIRTRLGRRLTSSTWGGGSIVRNAANVSRIM